MPDNYKVQHGCHDCEHSDYFRAEQMFACRKHDEWAKHAGICDLHPSRSERCKWTEDDEGTWETSCGEAFEFFYCGPVENGMRYCPYCGKPLEVVAREDETDE